MTADADLLPVTERTTIGRSPQRGARDRTALEAVLDEGLLCHVGLTTAQPVQDIFTELQRIQQTDSETLDPAEAGETFAVAACGG